MAQFDRIEKVLKPLKGVWFYCGYDRFEINRRSSQILNHQRFMPNETLVLMRFFGKFCLNPYPWVFWDRHRALFLEKISKIITGDVTVGTWDHHREWFMEKKSKIITGDVTVGTWKLYVQIECQLGYIMMLISNGICQYERKYAALNENISISWERNRACFPEKIQRTETYTNRCNAALWIFPKKPARWRSRDLRIRVKTSH